MNVLPRLRPRSQLTALAVLSGLFLAAPVHAALPLQPEQIVATCFSGTMNIFVTSPNPVQIMPNTGPNGYVVALFDTTTGNIGPLIPTPAQPPTVWNGLNTPPFSGFHNETGIPWTASKLGEVFGIAVDDATPPNIYVTATECYNAYGMTGLPTGAGGRGGVYRLDGTTGAPTPSSLPNDPSVGPALGNVCYRRAANGTGYIYVSNFEDGMIYRMNAAGAMPVVGTPYDHGVQGRPQETPPLSILADDLQPGITQFGRRVWGLKTFGNRLFYAVWWEDARNISATESNEIWSVDLDNNGDFLPLTARRRILVPNLTFNNWSYPVASIDFSQSGTMFLAERCWQVWPLYPPAQPQFGAHHTRILRYTLSGNNWVTTPNTTHHIGGDASFAYPATQLGANSAGGVAVNCDESIWATGDMFKGSYSQPPNFQGNPGDLGWVYGAMRIPTGGNSALAGYGYGGFAIDFDGQTNGIQKFSVGAVATVRECCIPPPPNMVAWWPLDEPNTATTYADYSGMGNNAVIESGPSLGTYPSPSATPGKVAGASFFIDSNTRGRAPDSTSLNFGAGSFTIDCWVNPIFASPQTWQPIVDKFDLAGQRGYVMGISNGTVVLRVGDGAASTHIGPPINYSAWNFVAAAVNRGNGTVRFFVNGVTSAPQPMPLTGSFNNTMDLFIGAASFPSNTTEVALDEIELFNRVLASNEVAAIWIADSRGKCKTPQPSGPCSNSVVTILCPPNTNVACAPVFHYPPPRASTTCGTITNVTCTPPSGSMFPTGTTTVTCCALDSQGNSNCCSFTVTLTPDTTPPVVDCMCLFAMAHELLEVSGCEGVVPDLCSFRQCYSDECCLKPCVQTPVAGTVVGPGVTSITITISDCAGNVASCMLPFTVTAPPDGCDPCPTCCAILCPTNMTVVTCGSDAVVNYPPPTLSPGCGPGVTITCTPPSGSVFPLGTTVVTCTGSGGGGSAIRPCSFSVTVVRNSNPWTLNCPPAPAIINVTGCPPVMPNITGLATVTSNCPLSCPVILSQSPPAGTPLTPGTHPAVITACDCFDLCRECSVVINAVSSSGIPTIMCPPNQVLLTCSNSAPATFKVKAGNNNGPVVCTPPSGSQFPLGTTTVMCMVTNNCGGKATCTFTVTVKPQPNRWLCGWHAGIGIPFEHRGGATTALRVAGPGVGVGPAICIFPNPLATNSGITLHPGPAQVVSFTTELPFDVPEGTSFEIALPPDPANPGGVPLLSFHRKSGPKGYCVKTSTKFTDDPAALYRHNCIETNGDLHTSIVWDAENMGTNVLLNIFYLPGVTSVVMSVTLDCVTRELTLGLLHCLWTTDAARKGWDGCIYGNRPPGGHHARLVLTPMTPVVSPPITQVELSMAGFGELLVEEPSLTALGRKWSDGHVTLMKAYDDGESGLEFRALADGGGVHVDLANTESFDFRLTHFESGDVPTEEQFLTRTIGPIRGLTNRPPPPFLDAMLMKTNPAVGGVDVSADFSNIDSPTVRVEVYDAGILMFVRPNIPATLNDVLLTAPGWPMRLGKLGGATPCRRGKPPFGAYRVSVGDLDGDGAPDFLTVMGDEFRVLAELAPDAPHPDYYSGFEFITSAGADWGVTQLNRTLACAPVPLTISHGSNGILIQWPGEGFRLLGAERVTGPWYDLGVDSPVTLPPAHDARFFRLFCD